MRSPENTNPLIAEFIGATGAGKSTLMAAVGEALVRQGCRVREADDLLLVRFGVGFITQPRLRSAVVHILAMPAFARYLCTRNGRSLTRLAVCSIMRGKERIWAVISLLRNYVKRLGADRLLASSAWHQCDIVLCDEGVVHAAHNLFVHAHVKPNADAIVRFGMLVPKPDVLIWVTAPTTQSAAVIQRRGHSRVYSPATEALTFAEHAHTTFELLAGVAGIHERIIRVDNAAAGTGACDADIQERASVIADFIRQTADRRLAVSSQTGVVHNALTCSMEAP